MSDTDTNNEPAPAAYGQKQWRDDWLFVWLAAWALSWLVVAVFLWVVIL